MRTYSGTRNIDVFHRNINIAGGMTPPLHTHPRCFVHDLLIHAFGVCLRITYIDNVSHVGYNKSDKGNRPAVSLYVYKKK